MKVVPTEIRLKIKTLVYNGDEITALKLYDDNQFVEIIGQVKAPGFYHYFAGMRFKDLIELSGGLSDTSYSKSVYLEQAEEEELKGIPKLFLEFFSHL